MSERDLPREIDQELEWVARRLADELDSLGNRLLRLSRNLQSHPQTTLVNDLGEIQAQGSIIDALCGKYGALSRLNKVP